MFYISESECLIRIADGNNTFISNSATQKSVKEILYPNLLWIDTTIKPIRCNFGARRDLCGAAAIMAALVFSYQHKSKNYADLLVIPPRIRQRILMDLQCDITNHDSPFTPRAYIKCDKCGSSFRSMRALGPHRRFCNEQNSGRQK